MLYGSAVVCITTLHTCWCAQLPHLYNSFTVHFYVFFFIYKTSYDCCEWTLKRTHYDYIALAASVCSAIHAAHSQHIHGYDYNGLAFGSSSYRCVLRKTSYF